MGEQVKPKSLRPRKYLKDRQRASMRERWRLSIRPQSGWTARLRTSWNTRHREGKKGAESGPGRGGEKKRKQRPVWTTPQLLAILLEGLEDSGMWE